MAGRTDYEYIVLGLGGIGSGTVYWLARRAGDNVLGLEQFELGHDRGASEDHSRVIRRTYHTPAYIALAHHAFSHWRMLEQEAGESLLVITGDLLLGPRQSRMPVTDYLEAMTEADLPFEYLDADEIQYRWPQWRLDTDIHATYQPHGGLVSAARANATHVRLARELGATIKERTPVTAIAPVSDGVEVSTDEQTYRCRRLVIAADAWTNQLLAPLGVTLPLTLTQEQVSYFASPRLDLFTPERFPVWIWADDPNFYGIPVHGEDAGVKAAQDMSGREITLATRTFDEDPAALERVTDFLRTHLPDALGPVLYSKTCIYTMTPDRDFVVDVLPAYPQISLALGAGHAFKFASLLGRILSDLAIEGPTEFDISPFSFQRPVLHMAAPPRNLLLRRENPESNTLLDAP
ncbi:MAG: N-methyl-L-tryptophan oxidase [Steroidobacteraceae bacterium]